MELLGLIFAEIIGVLVHVLIEVRTIHANTGKKATPNIVFGEYWATEWPTFMLHLVLIPVGIWVLKITNVQGDVKIPFFENPVPFIDIKMLIMFGWGLLCDFLLILGLGNTKTKLQAKYGDANGNIPEPISKV